MNDERIDLYKQFERINYIDPSYYEKFRVKRGLRNADGTGVLAGMTNISNVHGYLLSDGDKLPDEGSLRLRGYEITDLLGEESSTTRFSFEEVAYLLLLGELPTRDQLDTFIAAIDAQRELPDGFTASMILKDTPPDIMNVLARSILLLYAYDPRRGRPLSRARDQHGNFPHVARAAHDGPYLLRSAGALPQRLHDHASLYPWPVNGRDHPVDASPQSRVHAGRGAHARRHAVPAC